ncbi:MAG: pentapeptide repeat-containing protein, partial [Elainellaceae cyanobacterium]
MANFRILGENEANFYGERHRAEAMANEEHVKILKQGVEAWNLWRQENPEVKPDLRSADLRSANLSNANLSNANLSNANLRYSDLSAANLSYSNLSAANLSAADLSYSNLSNSNLRYSDLNAANLSYSNLRYSDLSAANLSYSNLSYSNLRYSDLSATNLSAAILSGAILSNANLRGAEINEGTQIDEKWRLVINILNQGGEGKNLTIQNFSDVNFSGANFTGAKLEYVNLKEANLSRCILSEIDLSKVELQGADLSNAILRKVNLSSADLSSTQLARADLTDANLARTQNFGTNFQGAVLTGACIADWNINSTTILDDVVCEYVYLQDNQQDRRPHNPNKTFALGEFTKRFQQVLETVDLFFDDGIDWKAFLATFQDLQAQYGNENLDIQGVERRSASSFEVRLAVTEELDKVAVEREAYQTYEINLRLLEAQHRAELQAKDKEIESYRRESANMREITRFLASREIKVEEPKMSLRLDQIRILRAIADGANLDREIAAQLNL